MKFVWVGLGAATALLGIVILGLWLFLFPPCTNSTLDSQWEAIVSSGGCMMGHDDWISGEGAGHREGWSVSSCWDRITSGDPAKVTPFLAAKLPSRRGTGVHVD